MINPLAHDTRFFGLPVWPKRPSDAEYVERIRKGLRVVLWIRYLYAAIGICVIVLGIWMIQEFIEFLKNAAAPAQQNMVNIALGTSIVVGLTIGFWMGSMAHSVARLFFGQRQEQLLVDCWDALSRLLAERKNISIDSMPIADDSRPELNVGAP